MENRSYPGTVLGDVVGAAAWGSKNYMLRGVGWLQADVYAACSVCAGVVLCFCNYVTRDDLMIRSPVQHVCTLVRLNFVY